MSDDAKLLAAAAQGNDAKVKRLLKAKVDVDCMVLDVQINMRRCTWRADTGTWAQRGCC